MNLDKKTAQVKTGTSVGGDRENGTKQKFIDAFRGWNSCIIRSLVVIFSWYMISRVKTGGHGTFTKRCSLNASLSVW